MCIRDRYQRRVHGERETTMYGSPNRPSQGMRMVEVSPDPRGNQRSRSDLVIDTRSTIEDVHAIENRPRRKYLEENYNVDYNPYKPPGQQDLLVYYANNSPTAMARRDYLFTKYPANKYDLGAQSRANGVVVESSGTRLRELAPLVPGQQNKDDGLARFYSIFNLKGNQQNDANFEAIRTRGASPSQTQGQSQGNNTYGGTGYRSNFDEGTNYFSGGGVYQSPNQYGSTQQILTSSAYYPEDTRQNSNNTQFTQNQGSRANASANQTQSSSNQGSQFNQTSESRRQYRYTYQTPETSYSYNYKIDPNNNTVYDYQINNGPSNPTFRQFFGFSFCFITLS
eukprot:TRINITY_DN2556_c0_g2_i1.p1 TRINITY_DN2556_c0_g2~~TRINITY_DN2556_c0_g2_i1.p1  ORF type:complete len:368 (-),score=55.59 TRINITY_DN2556_c0_g2_i1:14-1030(-)